MSLLPQKLSRTEEGAGRLLPPQDRAPLVVHLRQIPVGMDIPGIEIRKQRLRRRPHAHALFQLLGAPMCHPGNLRREALDMILLLLEQALRNQARQVDILHSGLLEPAVQLILDVLPDRVSRRLDHHESLQLCVPGQICLLDYVRIPLGKVFLHRSDLFDKLLLIRHAALSLFPDIIIL